MMLTNPHFTGTQDRRASFSNHCNAGVTSWEYGICVYSRTSRVYCDVTGVGDPMPSFAIRRICAMLLWVGVVTCVAQAQTRPVGRVVTPEIRIDTGVLRGLIVGAKNDICVYKGIPFAAPPVGDLRWKAPRPPEAWQGVRDCFEFGPACP